MSYEISSEQVSDSLSLIVEESSLSRPDKPVVTADITTPTNQNVTLKATFSSNSKKKLYSFDKEDWHSYHKSGVVVKKNQTVYFRAYNDFGISSEITKYKVTNIDKTPPKKPTVAADVTTRTSGPVTVSATFTKDSESREYSFDKQTWQPYTSSLVFNENGTIHFRAIDAVGNISKITTYEVANISADAPEPVVTDLSMSGEIDPGSVTNFTPNLPEAGLYTLGGTFGTRRGTVTVVDKTGKKVGSGTVKNGVVTCNKDLLLDNHDNSYKVIIKNTDKKDGVSAYSVELKVKELFTKGDNSDDTIAGAKPLVPGTFADNWVGYGDAVDYYALGVDANGGFYDLDISGVRNSVKLTVYSAQARKIRSVTVSAKKPAVKLAGLCLAPESYAVVEAPQAAKARNSDYKLLFTEKATFTGAQNNDWSHAEVLDPGDTFSGTLTKAPGGDMVDYCDVTKIDALTFGMTAGKIKVSFHDAAYNKVKVASVTMADGSEKANASSLTLAAGNVTTASFTIAAIDAAVKYLKIEAAGKTLNGYTITNIA